MLQEKGIVRGAAMSKAHITRGMQKLARRHLLDT